MSISEGVTITKTGEQGAFGGELLTVNFGPHHPSTHGVLRLIVDLDGEQVRSVKPVIGYLHTGIEKEFEVKLYQQGVTLTDLIALVNHDFEHTGHDLGANILGHLHPNSFRLLTGSYRTTTPGGRGCRRAVRGCSGRARRIRAPQTP